jgi:hypothetical protein
VRLVEEDPRVAVGRVLVVAVVVVVALVHPALLRVEVQRLAEHAVDVQVQRAVMPPPDAAVRDAGADVEALIGWPVVLVHCTRLAGAGQVDVGVARTPPGRRWSTASSAPRSATPTAAPPPGVPASAS